MAKKILSVLCAAFLLFGGMAFSADPAFAAAEDKALQTGTAGIDDPVRTENSKGAYYTPSDYVWFGSYAAMYGAAPLK